MRWIVGFVVASLALLVSSAATAEPKRALTHEEPALALTLLDGFRAGPITVHSIAVKGRQGERDSDRSEDPGEAVTQYVEQVWSQVRAYRRPGGAEFIVRGRF